MKHTLEKSTSLHFPREDVKLMSHATTSKAGLSVPEFGFHQRQMVDDPKLFKGVL